VASALTLMANFFMIGTELAEGR